MNSDKKAKNLERLLSAFDDTEYTTPDDVAEALNAVVDASSQANKHILGKVEAHVQDSNGHHLNIYSHIEEVGHRIDQTADTLNKKIESIELTPGQPGKDAEPVDEESVVSKLLDRIKLPEQQAELQITRDTAEDIRNKLELLEGDERLDASAIKGLQDVLKGYNSGNETHILAANRSLYQLLDVNAAGITNGQYLAYQSATKTFVPASPGAASAITGLIGPGTNVTFTGNGTSASPYVVNATGGGSGASIGGAVTSGTQGSVLFINPAGVLAQDNANFFYDATNHRMGLQTLTPAATLDIGTGDARIQNGRLNLSNGANNLEYLYSPASSGQVYLGSRNNVVFLADNDNNGIGDISFKTGSNVQDATTGAKMYITNSGNVGINTTSPSSLLHIKSTGSYQGILIENSDNAQLSFKGSTGTSSITGGDLGASLYFRPYNTNNVVALTNVAWNNIAASASAGTTTTQSHYYVLRNRYWNGSSSLDQDFTLTHFMESTAPLSRVAFNIAGNEIFTVRSTGNVGVNTNNPLNNLHVSSLAGSIVRISSTNSGANDETLTFNTSFPTTANAGKTLAQVTGAPDSSSGGRLVIRTSDTGGTLNEVARFTAQGRLGIGNTSPTGIIHIKAGTATANTAPLKFTSGVNLTTPEDGTIEYNGTHFYGTVGTTRYQLDQQSGGGGTPGGSTTQVQYNNAGAFGANSGFTSDTSGNVSVLNLITTGTANTTPFIKSGSAVGTNNVAVGGRGWEFGGSAANANAFVDLFLQNDSSVGNSANFAVVNYNSSTYSYTGYGTAIAVPNQLAMYSSNGPTLIGSAWANANARLDVAIGGTATSNIVATYSSTGLKINGSLTLGPLTTNGLLKTTGGTGVVALATAGTDYQAPITLTTTGTSGAATFSGGTLNIPNYASGGGTGTVTSVAASGGTTGLTFSGSPITTSGTLTLAGTLAIANGGTGQTTANAAFNALAPSQSARRYLRSDGTNTSWAFSHANPSTFLVAASNASAEDKAIADYVCTGTADDITIQSAITATGGQGTVLLSAGTFNTTTTIAFAGTGVNGGTISMRGQGNQATIIVPSSGTHAITLSGNVKVNFSDFGGTLAGTSDFIRSTAPTTGSLWSFWESSFKNIKVRGDYSAHSGWVLNMQNPFRSTFENIDGEGIGNGMWFKSTSSAFNPGNCTFTRCFMDLGAAANGTAYYLQTGDGFGNMNIMTFVHCEGIDNASSTTSIGWRLKGSGTDYHSTSNIKIINSNIETFNTCVDLNHAVDNEIELTYANTKNNGTIFNASSDSSRNVCIARSSYIPPSTTTYFVKDAQSNAATPNQFRGLDTYVDTGASLLITKTSATIIDQVNAGASSGNTIDPLFNQFDVYASILRGVRIGTTAPTTGQALVATGTGAAAWSTVTAGAGGSTTQVQYNNAGALAGNAAFTTDTSGNVKVNSLTSAGIVNVPNLAPSTAIPSTPAANTATVYSQGNVGQAILETIDETGNVRPLGSHLGRKSVMAGFANMGLTTFTLMGSVGTTTYFGTAAGVSVANTNYFSQVPKVTIPTTAAASSLAGVKFTTGSGINYVTRGSAAGIGGFSFSMRGGIVVSASTMNWFMGLTGSTNAKGNAAAGAEVSTITNMVVIGCDSTDTNLQLMYNNGSGTATKIDLGTNFPAKTSATDIYDLQVDCAPNGSNMYYTVTRMNTGNISSGTLTGAKLPVNTVFMNPQMFADTMTGTTIVTPALNKFYIETPY